jgi:hypothetical protein
MSRRHNRNKLPKTPPTQRYGNGHERVYQFTEPPPAPPVTDFSQVRIVADPNPPPPLTDGDGSAEAGRGSRFNAVRDGLRSRFLFPDAMQQAIDERVVAFSAQLNPRTLLERWLVRELARGSVQTDFAADRLLANLPLAVERVDNRWADDRREEAEKLGNRLSKAPYRIARALARTKYGALYLIDKLTSIGESITANRSLDAEQRDYLFDVLGVDPVLRNGSLKVPAANDASGLARVVENERARLSLKVERELDARDQAEQNAARLGIVRSYDQETRNLRSDERRAQRRYDWAWSVLGQVRRGVDPSTIIDPETKRPINPRASAPPAPEPAPPAPPPPTSPPAEAPSSPTFQMPPIPEGCPEDVKEIFLLLGAAFQGARKRTDDETPPSDEPSGEPGPPSA